MPVEKLKVRCQMCARSTKLGWLWLGRGDWVECPDCGGTGKIEVVQTTVKARTRQLFVPKAGGGLSSDVHVLTPSGWRDRHGAL